MYIYFKKDKTFPRDTKDQKEMEGLTVFWEGQMQIVKCQFSLK